MSSTPRRLVTASAPATTSRKDPLRPQRLAEFIGQQQARSNLKVFIDAARARKEALDHVLFVGPPGLGKTTLAQIVARELGVNFRATSGPVIAKAGDLAALLTNLEDRDVLFIDEIHRLNPAVEEILYPAMEDYQLDLIIGEGPAARLGQDRPGALHAGRSNHARGPAHQSAARPFHSGAAQLLFGERARGDRQSRRARARHRHDRRQRQRDRAPRPRHTAHRRAAAAPRARLCADRRHHGHRPSPPTVRWSSSRSMPLGLDAMDRRYLAIIAENYGGGPVGIETIAAALSEPRDALEEIIEPFLIERLPAANPARTSAHLACLPASRFASKPATPRNFDFSERRPTIRPVLGKTLRDVIANERQRW